MILVERAARIEAEALAATARATAANARANASSGEALIAHLKLEIEKLRRELYGTRSERKARLLDQFEMQLEDLVVRFRHLLPIATALWANVGIKGPPATI